MAPITCGKPGSLELKCKCKICAQNIKGESKLKGHIQKYWRDKEQTFCTNSMVTPPQLIRRGQSTFTATQYLHFLQSLCFLETTMAKLRNLWRRKKLNMQKNAWPKSYLSHLPGFCYLNSIFKISDTDRASTGQFHVIHSYHLLLFCPYVLKKDALHIKYYNALHIKYYNLTFHASFALNILVETWIACKECAKTLLLLSILTNHMHSLHQLLQIYFPCKFCAKSFNLSWNIIRHVHRLHSQH